MGQSLRAPFSKGVPHRRNDHGGMAVIAWVVIIVLVVFFVVPMSNEVKGWWVFSCLLLLLLSEVCALLSVYSALITAAIRSIFRPEKIVRDVILTPIKDELDCIMLSWLQTTRNAIWSTR